MASSALRMPKNATMPASTRSTSVTLKVRSKTASDSSSSLALERTRAVAPASERTAASTRATSASAAEVEADAGQLVVAPVAAVAIERHHDGRHAGVEVAKRARDRQAPQSVRCRQLELVADAKVAARTRGAPTR